MRVVRHPTVRGDSFSECMDALIAEDAAESLKRLCGADCLEEPQENRAALDGRSAAHKTNAMSRVWKQFLSKVSAVNGPVLGGNSTFWWQKMHHSMFHCLC